MLLKLVQSIQNSICQEGKKGKYVLEEIEEKTCDPPVANLLEKNKTVRVRRGLNKTRPRSGYESFGQGKYLKIKKYFSVTVTSCVSNFLEGFFVFVVSLLLIYVD